jgi:hypothetical protein
MTMAVFDELFEGWGTTGLVGAGAVLAAPVLFPVVGSILRPVAKGVIWGALAVSASAQGLWAGAGEGLSELYAEAQQEYTQRYRASAPRRSRAP